MTIGIYHWLVLSGLLFGLGIYGVLSRRNAIMVLMAMELIMNAGAINFVAFNYYVTPENLRGQIFTLFVIAIAAAEAAVGIAMVLRLVRVHRTVDLSTATELKW